MANDAKKDDYTEEQMAEFDAIRQKTGRFPENTVFDGGAEARGEPRYRKITADDKKEVAGPSAPQG